MDQKRTMFDNDGTGCAPIVLVAGILATIWKLIEYLPNIIEAIKK